MGKQSHTVIILALCVFLLTGAAWYIGLEQSYQQKQASLKNFVQLLSATNNKMSKGQQDRLAHQQNFKLYRIIRNQYELVSIKPNDHNLNKTLILQSLQQADGFISAPENSENTLFYKHQIDKKTVLIASASLITVRQSYITATQKPMLTLLTLGLILSLVLFLWQYSQWSNFRKKKGLLEKQKRALGVYLKLDTNFQIIECNSDFIATFPNSKNVNIRHLIKSSERERVEQYLSQALASKTLIDFECTLIQEHQGNETFNQQDDESRWAMRAKPIVDNNQAYILISADDISKRHYMEVELRHERNRMQAYLNTMHTLLIITDRHGKIIEANRQFMLLIGGSENSIINKPISHFCPKRSHHKINNYLRNLTPEAGSTVSAEFPLVAITGKEYTIDWRITSVPNDSDSDNNDDYRENHSEEILLTGLDITESVANNQALKLANIQIREALRSAESANQSKSVFLANMSHEIRTPMNGILGAAELILDQTTDDEKKQYIDIIHSSSHSLLNIINDILDLSKIESGSFELEQINFDLHQLCNEVYQLFSSAAKQKGIQILYFYGADLPQFWIGDPNRIRQILNNLFSNALKFTHQGRIDLRVQGERLANHQYDLKIQVKDSGIGIAEKKVGHIFSAFQQADTSTSRKYGGTGLGLTISQHLASAMQGIIEVESELGTGSTFSLHVPLKPGVIENRIKRSGLIRNYQAKVLLAEDNEVNAKIASKILTKLGIEATVVENGELAIHETTAKTFDLILMDINMPIMDGITATEKIRELSFPKNQVPILALTANAMMEDKERCINAGMNGFISKPIKLERLVEELDNVLSCVD
ncbi:Sensor protein [Oleispira antarctica RB-8]|uniref:Sensory/regulatory protein RpfC n=1 Tax=Oleispira antarctica RB-8 TaxID=698738 RepID=R4YRV3_OLEAN|nr:Sensor protein [Oleispira antarctica RB-8]